MKFLRVLLAMALVSSIAAGTSGCNMWPFKKKPAPLPPATETPVGKDIFGPSTLPGGLNDGTSPIGSKIGGGLRPGGKFTPIAENNGHWNDILYFAFDRSDVGDAERPKLDKLATYLKDNADYCVQIEGNCDERGSDEYNRGLSERRAMAVRDYLVSLGVADNRLETVGMGIEKPAVPNATSEDQHALNRRAEFVIGTRE